MFFVAPPSMDELERRLRRRGDTTEEDIEDRLEIAESEMEEAPTLFDHVVVNEDLDRAIDEIVGLITGA
jgi:guanylate kinase